MYIYVLLSSLPDTTVREQVYSTRSIALNSSAHVTAAFHGRHISRRCFCMSCLICVDVKLSVWSRTVLSISPSLPVLSSFRCFFFSLLIVPGARNPVIIIVVVVVVVVFLWVHGLLFVLSLCVVLFCCLVLLGVRNRVHT